MPKPKKNSVKDAVAEWRKLVTSSTKKLYQLAKEAQTRSYSPYSKYPVGASVRSGRQFFAGTNVENASYGATICAERVAIVTAVAAGHRRIDEICLVTSNSEGAAPCGMCLQVISEFSGPDTKLWIANPKEILGLYRLKELFGFRFTKKDLKLKSKQAQRR